MASTAPLPLQFVRSASQHDQLPDARAEVALLGRSNVGKSSLLNALAGRKALAKVSGTPGRTRLLNAFALDADTQVVDCPGYGYAKAGRGERDQWMAMIEDYLVDREPLRMLLLLVDSRHGPAKADTQVLAELREAEVPLTVVATKVDKVKPSTRAKRRADLAGGCGVAVDDVWWVSATKGTGIGPLRAEVRRLLR